MKPNSTLALAFGAGLSFFAATGALLQQTQEAALASPALTANASPDTSLTETPAWAESFVNSVGLDSSFEDRQYPPLVTQELFWSGIRHLRDGSSPTASFVAQMKILGQHGINHSVGMPRGFTASALRAQLAAFAPYVDFVEPANEADNFTNPNWAQMRSDQRNLWNVVRSNTAWNGIAVVGPSFANPKAHAALVGPLDAYENAGQIHNATCDWNPGTDIVWVSIDVNTTLIRATTVYKPLWTTETGYTDNLARGCSLHDNIIAKYTTRTSTERWLHGEPRTYFNVLADRPNDVVFGAMGLLHSNGTPKPQFLALGNMVRLLTDTGAQPRPTRVSYTISGATSDVHHLLLARSDGTYDLLVYRELPCWDHFKHAAIAVPAEHVTLTLPGAKNAALYAYNSSYSFNRSTLGIGRNYQTSSFSVTDSISVVHFGY